MVGVSELSAAAHAYKKAAEGGDRPGKKCMKVKGKYGIPSGYVKHSY
jgi:hypothetical protein